MAKAIEKKFDQEARIYDDGEIIFREGEETREMYIVQRGEVVVSKKGPRGEIELAVLKKGDFVGEMSLLESLPRTATARARGKTSLLAIHPGGFLLKIRRDPTFAFEMMQTLSRRIRMTNENLMRELGRDVTQKEAVQTALTRSEFDSSPSAEAKT